MLLHTFYRWCQLNLDPKICEKLSGLIHIWLIQSEPARVAILSTMSLLGKPLGTGDNRNHYIKFRWELTSPEPKIDNSPSAVKLKLVAILSMMS